MQEMAEQNSGKQKLAIVFTMCDSVYSQPLSFYIEKKIPHKCTFVFIVF